MGYILIESFPGFTFYVAVAVFACLVTIPIFVWHAYYEIRHEINHDSSDYDSGILSKIYRYSLFATLMFYPINTVFTAISLLSTAVTSAHVSVMGCEQYGHPGVVLYGICLVPLHTALICRLHIAFYGSIYQYSNRVLYSLLISCVCVLSFMVVLGVVTMICDIITVTHNDVSYHINNISFPSWFSAALAIIILTYSGVTIFLFISPLRRLIKATRLSKDGVLDPVQKLAVKAGVTSVTALSTTVFTFFLMPAFGGSVFVRLDIAVNAVCLACQCQHFDWLYQKLFFCAEAYIRRMEVRVFAEFAIKSKTPQLSPSPQPSAVASETKPSTVSQQSGVSLVMVGSQSAGVESE